MQEGAVQFLDVGTNSPDSSGDPTSFENNLTTTDSRIRYQGGMSYAQFMTVVEDIRWEPPWRRQADKCSDYYDGNQLDSEALQRMQERGIAPLVYNITKPVIDVCIGMEAKNRTDYRVSEGGAAPEEWTQAEPQTRPCGAQVARRQGLRGRLRRPAEGRAWLGGREPRDEPV